MSGSSIISSTCSVRKESTRSKGNRVETWTNITRHVPPSYIYIYIFREGCFKFSKGVQRPRKLKYEVLRILWKGGGGGGSLGEGDIGEETGQFRGWIERLSSQGEQSLRQIFTRECILSMWVSATLDHEGGRVGHRGPNWGTVATHSLPRSIPPTPL